MRSPLPVSTLLLCLYALPCIAGPAHPDPGRKQAIASDELKQIRSVLLQVDGQVVYEGYFNGADAQTLHDVRSASKSVTALLVGAAIGDGRLPGVRAKVYDYFPAFVAHHDVDPRLRGTTVEDLLAMSTLWECDDENPFSAGHEERMYVGERWLDFALALPVKGFAPWMARPEDSPHGRAFAYCTANSFVLGAVLERATGQPLADYAAHALERPLGITHSQWNRSPRASAWAEAAHATAAGTWPALASSCLMAVVGRGASWFHATTSPRCCHRRQRPATAAITAINGGA